MKISICKRPLETQAPRTDSLHRSFAVWEMGNAFLLKIGEEPIERPQHMFMRSAIAIHPESVDKAIECYDMISTRYFLPAASTLARAGTLHPLLTPAFTIPIHSNQVHDIFQSISETAVLWQLGASVNLGVQGMPASTCV